MGNHRVSKRACPMAETSFLLKIYFVSIYREVIKPECFGKGSTPSRSDSSKEDLCPNVRMF